MKTRCVPCDDPRQFSVTHHPRLPAFNLPLSFLSFFFSSSFFFLSPVSRTRSVQVSATNFIAELAELRRALLKVNSSLIRRTASLSARRK